MNWERKRYVPSSVMKVLQVLVWCYELNLYLKMSVWDKHQRLQLLFFFCIPCSQNFCVLFLPSVVFCVVLLWGGCVGFCCCFSCPPLSLTFLPVLFFLFHHFYHPSLQFEMEKQYFGFFCCSSSCLVFVLLCCRIVNWEGCSILFIWALYERYKQTPPCSNER